MSYEHVIEVDAGASVPEVHYSSRQNRRLEIIPSGSQQSRHRSIRLALRPQSSRSDLEVSVEDSNDDPFTFLSGDADPTKMMPTKQQKRAKKAIENTISALATKDTEEDKKGCCDYLNGCCTHALKVKDFEEADVLEHAQSSTELTPEMQKASQQGWTMIKSIIFPALPAIAQDLWVYLELLISIVAFALGHVDILPLECGHAYNYSYFVLAAISMVLAFIDGFIYFFQLGSCARCIRDCHGNSGETQSCHGLVEGTTSEDDDRKCYCLNKKWKEEFNTWLEFGRNLLSELLLYPLLIFDLFDFILGAGYQPVGTLQQLNFSLFVIGGLYLILSVYIMRILMVAGSMLSLNRIPNNKEATAIDSTSDTFILVRFCIHILGQIAAHLMIVIAVAAKIYNENRSTIEKSMNMTSGVMMNSSCANGRQVLDIKASPFLITTIVLGWVIPLAGVFIFFIVNYYWMKEFSIGFWLNMISLLQGESFAETVFGGNTLSAAKEKALELVKATQYKKIKKQLQRFKATPVLVKFFFPARILITAISGLLYDIILLAFIICMMLTYEDGSVRHVVFSDDNVMTAVFVLLIVTIILANIHALILLNIVLFMVVIIFAIAAAIAVFLSPLLLFGFFPTVAYAGYYLLFIDARLAFKRKYEVDASDPTEPAHQTTDDTNNAAEIEMESTSLESKL